MKKLLTLAVLFTLVIVSCEQPLDEETTPKLPTLTIKNQSSYVLTGVTFSGITFASSGNDLAVSAQAQKEIPDDTAKTGYITFVRKDIGISCRTQIIAVPEEGYTFTFLDDTTVEQVGNSSNTSGLGTINFVSTMALEYDGKNVPKNDIADFSETAINKTTAHEFTIKSTGEGKLTLTGTSPITVSGENSDVFTIVQPASSEITADKPLTFKINFTPTAEQTYNATVAIKSNARDGDFTFSVTAKGVSPKPIAAVFFGDEKITQNGTITAGDVLITQAKRLTVKIKNEGDEVLTIDTANIAIGGEDTAAFTKTTTPGSNISPAGETTFDIQYKPTKEGANQASLTIPTNDSSRNPIVVYLEGTATKGSAVLELSQGDTSITHNGLEAFDFGRVEIGSYQNYTFTIKNTGDIPLELNGESIVESANPAFTVSNQPTSITITTGATASFVLRFTPNAEGVISGQISITNNGSIPQFTFAVKGNGYQKKPQITVTQGASTVDPYAVYNFETVAINESKDITFTIGNTGDAALTFEAVDGNRINLTENTSGYFTVVSQPVSNTVAPGGTASFAVRYKPTEVGTDFIATIGIKTNSRDNDDFRFIVHGNSYQRQPQITVTQGDSIINPSGEYDFGTVRQTSTKDIIFTVTNSGEASLTFVNNTDDNRIYLEDDTANAFAVTVQPLASTILTPGITSEFNIQFNPPADGTYLATVVISTNSHENSLFYFRVKGVGSNTYKIGDTGPAGGIVFYDKGDSTDGWQYLEAAPSTTESSAEWGAYGYTVSGLQEGVGVGEANTTIIVNALNARGQTGKAAQVCDLLVFGGCSDWFLPSKSELDLMYKTLKVEGLGNFKSGYYWSSSQDDNSHAWDQSFSAGSQNSSSRNDSDYVRAVRAF